MESSATRSRRLAAALADLTIVDFLPGEFAEADSCALATISAPVFDAAGRVVMSYQHSPIDVSVRAKYGTLARVVEFARATW